MASAGRFDVRRPPTQHGSKLRANRCDPTTIANWSAQVESSILWLTRARAGGIALHQVPHQQLKVGTHDDICVPQASIAIIDLLDDGPCEVCAHAGLASLQAMLTQVCADALFQHLGTSTIEIRTIHACTLDDIHIHGRVRHASRPASCRYIEHTAYAIQVAHASLKV